MHVCVLSHLNYVQLNNPIDGGEGNGNPLRYSCLENPMDGGAWWAIVHGVTKSRTRLNDFTFTFTITSQNYWFKCNKIMCENNDVT